MTDGFDDSVDGYEGYGYARDEDSLLPTDWALRPRASASTIKRRQRWALAVAFVVVLAASAGITLLLLSSGHSSPTPTAAAAASSSPAAQRSSAGPMATTTTSPPVVSTSAASAPTPSATKTATRATPTPSPSPSRTHLVRPTPSPSRTAPRVIPSTAAPTRHSISLNAACRLAYPGTHAVRGADSPIGTDCAFQDPSVQPALLAQIDLDRYCAHKYGSAWYSEATPPSGWVCRT